MQDGELVAAIVAGDLGGLGEAYDRYAAALYTYCRFMLPDPHRPDAAADAVADTFIVAAAKLPGLRDPDQLRSWLYAVARNECQRQLGPGEPAGRAGSPGRVADAAGGGSGPAPDDAMPEVSPPAGLRERVLTEGMDKTPTGRAHRASVTHRAGPFGSSGFPKPVIPPGPRWWPEVRRHPRVAAAVAAVAAAVVVAGVVVLLVASGPHRARASTVALGGGNFATSSPAGGPSSPSRKPIPAAGASSASISLADGPTADPSTSPGTVRSSAPARSSPSASPSPSPSPSPTPGTLRVAPTKLALTAVTGKPASGTFIVTAVGGPVNFLIHSSNAKVTVSPASGSLGYSGAWVTVKVTVRSLVALNARITVDPGNLVVTVVFSIRV